MGLPKPSSSSFPNGYRCSHVEFLATMGTVGHWLQPKILDMISSL
jgi:hypothetical protein